jgi:mannose-6-phosphate isomerase-like protein (cupin superfamily)
MITSLIGGIGLTWVKVYQQHVAPDGVHSGCPHIHAITDEAYYVVSGRGYAELHDPINGFRTVSLEVGTYVDFTPGVLHRLVNQDRLEIIGIMGNAGLAESGDARVYFGPEIDEGDPAEYEAIWTLPKIHGLDGALERRDRAVAAYAKLLQLWRDDHSAYIAELRRFWDRTLQTTSVQQARFSDHVANGAGATAARVQSRIDTLPRSDEAFQIRAQSRSHPVLLGMCGELHPVLAPSEHLILRKTPVASDLSLTRDSGN